MPDDIDWPAIWTATATQLDGYRDVGLEALLTEDVLRFATIQQLVAAGVQPSRLEAEWRRAGVPDAVDLVVAGTAPAAVEFKFPREPRETNAAWTQHLGEALKDFYRLAHMPSDFAQRWCVQLLSDRMVRYLDGIAERYGVRLGLTPGSRTVLEPAAVRGLPQTALGRLSRWVDDLPAVTARCVVVPRMSAGLRLVVHAVDRAA